MDERPRASGAPALVGTSCEAVVVRDDPEWWEDLVVEERTRMVGTVGTGVDVVVQGHTFAIAELSPRGGGLAVLVMRPPCLLALDRDEVAEFPSAIADGLQPAAVCRPSPPHICRLRWWALPFWVRSACTCNT